MILTISFNLPDPAALYLSHAELSDLILMFVSVDLIIWPRHALNWDILTLSSSLGYSVYLHLNMLLSNTGGN